MKHGIEDALDQLDAYDACQQARDWVAAQPDTDTAWKTCTNPRWLYFLLYYTRPEVKGTGFQYLIPHVVQAMRLHLTTYMQTVVDLYIERGNYVISAKYLTHDATCVDIACHAIATSQSPWREISDALDYGWVTGQQLCDAIRTKYPTWPWEKS